MRFLTFTSLLFLLLVLLGGCATVPGKQVDEQIAPIMAAQESQARSELDSLFGGEAATESEPDDDHKSAEDLFK